MTKRATEGWRRIAVLKSSVVACLLNLAIMEFWQRYIDPPVFNDPMWTLSSMVVALAVLFSWIVTITGLSLLVFVWTIFPTKLSRRFDDVALFVLLGTLIAVAPIVFNDGPGGSASLMPLFATFGGASALVFVSMNLRRFGQTTST